MTISENNLEPDFGKVLFGVQKSIRYHTSRHSFYEGFSKSISFGIIFLSGFWGVLLSGGAGAAHVFIWPTLVIILSALDMACKPAAMGELHKLLARQFNDLDVKMRMSEHKEASAKMFQAKRQEIEATEPPDRAVLNLHIHNQLCQAIERTDNIVHIPPLRRWLRHIIDLPPKKWERVTEREARKRESAKPELQAST